MVLLELFWVFVKIGFTSFGGLSMIPLISSEMLSHGWMTVSEVADIVAIAEMTPGPIGLNSATFVGIRVAGIVGALCANLGVVMPTLTVGIAAAVSLEAFKDNKYLNNAMYGIRPACIGMILYVMYTLSATNFVVGAAISWPAIAIGIAIALLLWKAKFSIPLAVITAAALGILIVR